MSGAADHPRGPVPPDGVERDVAAGQAPRVAKRDGAARAPRVASAARLRCERGQATIELVALLPLCATFGLAIGHVVAAEATRELAGHAAEAAAIAVGNGGDAEDAARAALPDWSKKRVAVDVSGREVRVRLEPPAVVPALADALASTVAADAGPAAE